MTQKHNGNRSLIHSSELIHIIGIISYDLYGMFHMLWSMSHRLCDMKGQGYLKTYR